METLNTIQQLEELYERNLIRIIANIAPCKNQFFNWLHDNENIKDTNEYKAAILLCSFYYFELEEYNKPSSNCYDSHPFSSEMRRLDFLFNKTIEIIDYFNTDIIKNLSFSKEIKDKLTIVISKDNIHNFLIYNNLNGHYNFKESMIRKYVNYYIDKHSSKYNTKIIEALKQSKIIKYTDNLFFIDQIYREYNRIMFDSDAFDNPKEEYDMYKGLTSKIECIQYKHNLDMYFFKLINWINNNRIIELYKFKTHMIYYLENNKSDYPEYNDFIEIIKVSEKMQEMSEENEQEFLDNKIKLNTNTKHQELIKTVKEEYKLDIDNLKKINEEWYEYIIQGQFHYELIKNSEVFDDYCGAVLYWCKCVESMMYEKIFKKLEKANSRYLFYLDVISSTHTLGTIPYICGFLKDKRSIEDKDKTRNIRDYIKWQDKVGKEYDFDKFLTDVTELNNKFRKTCAHRETIKYSNAEECRRLIFITSQMINRLIEL